MSVINWLLIRGAEAVWWLWNVLITFFSWLFSLLDALINPLLSPVLAVLNPTCTFLGDLAYAAIGLLPITWGLVVISIAVGLVMLIAFRRLSNQAAIGRAKDDIKANLLALKLFKDDLRVMFLCQGRILWAALRLQRFVLVPVLWMALPMLLLLAQMGVRYQWRPLRPGEQSLIRLRLTAAASKAAIATLQPSPGVVVEVGPVPGGGEVVWRIRGGDIGRHTLVFHMDAKAIEKEIVVGEALERVSATRPAARWTAQLLHPTEGRCPRETGAESIEIEYPARNSWIHGSDYWVVTFFVVSMIAALLLAPWFRVRF